MQGGGTHRLGGKWRRDRTGNTSIPFFHATEHTPAHTLYPLPRRTAKLPYLFYQIPIRRAQRCHYLEQQLLCRRPWRMKKYINILKSCLNVWARDVTRHLIKRATRCSSKQTAGAEEPAGTLWLLCFALHLRQLKSCFLWLRNGRDSWRMEGGGLEWGRKWDHSRDNERKLQRAMSISYSDSFKGYIKFYHNMQPLSQNNLYANTALRIVWALGNSASQIFLPSEWVLLFADVL